MKRRTPARKAAMIHALETAIEYLQHPDMTIMVGFPHDPDQLASFLRTDINLIGAPGKMEEKKYVLDDLQLAADYLDHPKIRALPFALNSSNIARSLREMIRDLSKI